MKQKGITLVALVITIIILLILAGIGINSLIGENGLLTRTKLAQTEYEKSQAKEELELKITTMQMEIVDEELRNATLEDFNELITEDEELTFISATYKTSITETDEEEYETIKVLYKNFIFTVDDTLVIIAVEENTNMANVEIDYEIKDITEVDGKTIYTILLRVKSNEKIVKVEYGDQVLKSDFGTKEIAIDFEAEKSIEYKLKITTLDGKEVEKTFIIDKEIITGIELNKTSIYLGIGKENTLQFNVSPSDAYYESIEWSTSDNTIATVDENRKSYCK